ncbi:AGC family protein kinase [Trichomonas vaginalis G3]|uniref:AGC family protein kinase n=1 Tax=Trichomonas vaginalis (strain ATCC PRA-98 / G3) TaxID=412133 RepID=A2DL59_TRIV3|nr:STKc AGC domain-containing protein [Trichomonas vaginalis G3]EAY18850.1 AGC family protein kinase [Trichomonas vaginalis G3]KAI5526044.1 STKc AGC domain-containing protein [Trichomonas vaginalis G3]|eukprot:XP_001579836.1 AGC family protein kinase [Trichomonas vaginalis G3]
MDDDNSSSNDIDDIMELKGWLKKKSLGEKKWVKRYLVLRENNLTLYFDETCKDADTTYQLSSNTTVEQIVDNNTPKFMLTIEGQDPITFSTDTSENVQKWITGIRSSFESSPVLSMSSFDILHVLGRGAFGKVMLVRHRSSMKLYAIKSIQKRKLLDAMKSHTVIAERNILMKAHHPFIVQLFFAFQNPSKFYLGLEYVPGGELFYHLTKRGTFPINEVRLYSAEIALALSYLHSIGIIYRDLKPENVMLDSTGHIKLTDFGLSTEVFELEECGDSFCGTSRYLSPEMIYKIKYTHKIDWWSLGILMYEMIVGHPPFDSQNRSQLYNDITHSDPVFPSSFPVDAKDLVCKLLTKNPNQRPDFSGIKDHVFFKGIDWDKVYNREYQPNFIPKQTTPNCDSVFLQESPADSIVTATSAQFPDFSFQGQSLCDSYQEWD